MSERPRPSDEPIISDPRFLRELARSAYVILRPVDDLADAFERWQRKTLGRLVGASVTVPVAHVTLKAFGSSGWPIAAADEGRIASTVESWATATPPIRLRAEALDVFDDPDEHVPVVRLAQISPLGDLWARGAEAGLPAGYSDRIGVDGWIPHLSLAYLDEVDPAEWREFVAWARSVDTRGASCLVREAELIAYDGGPERRLGRYALCGEPGTRSRSPAVTP